LKTSVNETVSLLLPVWSRARIPTCHQNHVITQIKKNTPRMAKLEEVYQSKKSSRVNKMIRFPEVIRYSDFFISPKT